MKQKPQIPALKSLLSYISPVTIEITSSSFNPYLEVILEGGKFSLNSRNTNYSYGSLHTLFKKTFRKLNLHWETINNALILGFGTGCVAKTINYYNPRCRIDGVEIDRKVIELGRKYFSTNELRNTTIHHFGAETYIAECRKKYDLVIIDVYNDIDVPAEIECERFLINVLNVLESGGIVIFNKFIYSKSTTDQLSSLEELYKKIFRNLEVITIMNSGKVFIAKKQM